MIPQSTRHYKIWQKDLTWAIYVLQRQHGHFIDIRFLTLFSKLETEFS